MKVRLLYEKPRSSKPNKTITKEKPAMIYLDLKEKAFLILSSNDTFQQSDPSYNLQQVLNFGMRNHKDINFII
jgi:hypothetical protein